MHGPATIHDFNGGQGKSKLSADYDLFVENKQRTDNGEGNKQNLERDKNDNAQYVQKIFFSY